MSQKLKSFLIEDTDPLLLFCMANVLTTYSDTLLECWNYWFSLDHRIFNYHIDYAYGDRFTKDFSIVIQIVGKFILVYIHC